MQGHEHVSRVKEFIKEEKVSLLGSFLPHGVQNGRLFFAPLAHCTLYALSAIMLC